MARTDRRRLTRRVQVDELGQGATYNVVAPLLNVTARSRAAEAARALSAALGLTSDILVAREQRKIDRLAQDFAEGERDARLGVIDEERRRTQPGYADAAAQVETAAAVADDEAELDELLKEDIEAGNVEEVRSKFQAFLKTKWEGLTDAQAAIVVPWAAGYETKVVEMAREQAARLVYERNYANLSKAAEQEWRESRFEARPFNFEGIHRAARELFGKETNAVLTDIFTRLIEQYNDSSLRDEMPDEWAPGVPSIKWTPGYRDKLDAATLKARKTREAEEAIKRSLAEYEARKRLDRKLADGTLIEQEVDELVQLGVLSPAVGAEYLDANRRRREAEMKEAAQREILGNLEDAFRSGTWHSFLLFLSQDKINDAFDQYVAAAAANTDDPLGFVAYSSMMNGLVYRPLAAQLSKFNIEDAQQFSNNVDTFRALYAQSPSLARRYVKDDSTFDLYVSAMTLTDYGRDAQQVMQEAKKADFAARQRAWMEGNLRKEALSAIDRLEIETLDSWFDQEVKDLRNRGWVIAEYQRLVDALGQTGNFASASEILDAANRIFEGRYMVIGNVALPRSADTPHDAAEAWEWFHDEWLQKELDAAGVALDASDVELRPDQRTSRDRATFALYYRDSYELVPGLADRRFTLDAIARQYRAEKVAKANANRAAAAKIANQPLPEIPPSEWRKPINRR